MNINQARLEKDKEALAVMQKFYAELKDKTDAEISDLTEDNEDGSNDDDIDNAENLSSTLEDLNSGLDTAVEKINEL